MNIYGNRRELEQCAAQLLAQACNSCLVRQPQVTFGVVGGRSVETVLKLFGKEKIDWDRVHLFMLDERLVDLDHPDSNYRLVESCVRSFIPPANLHPFDPQGQDAWQALECYREKLLEFGGRFDVVLLSCGEDGHIASLFPEHETIDCDVPFFLLTNSAPKPPSCRMTASAGLIGRSGNAVLLFLGPEKKRALEVCLDEGVSIRQCPAKVVLTVTNHFLLADSEEEIP